MLKGVGLSYRENFKENIDFIAKDIDFFEVTLTPGSVEDVKSFNRPSVIHSINLSIGSVDFGYSNRLKRLEDAISILEPVWISEHLSFSNNKEIEINSFIPMPYIEESIETVVNNVKSLKKYIQKPIALENITHNFTWPGNKYTEGEFIKEICIRADCGVLLDVTNLYLNSKMHGYDPYEFLNTIPSDRIMQLHLAGYSEINGYFYDSHVGGISNEIMNYAEWILKNTSCEALVIERDNDLDNIDSLMSDINLCVDLYRKYHKSYIF
ncbi:multinuclear nonheme iron-dependent oxidase [Bacillus pseudomycoides]|uniref:multinuclear nonheme iron-dependent oxidase n=1 Tax=Bacillus pseudomycoides TaxID=64104 RepID=UPI000BF8F9F5|nr:DUF692 family multinuclear iron-containing protein [Bacillus pseudomycoides]PEP63512.1 hypothetical protein CN564_04295 [Bacillus pseudomycoides]PHC96862.1 hypothetical protein COF36_05175 [Bacillus pseudomycoides]